MNWELLSKYLADECTREEVQDVERWLKKSTLNRQFMDSYKEIWDVEPENDLVVDSRKAWIKLQANMESDHSSAPNTGVPIGEGRGRRKMPLLAYSLSAAAVILIAIMFYQYVGIQSAKNAAQDPPQMVQVIETERGQRTAFRLHDGTRVQLNSDSEIRIPPEYGDSVRAIYLAGEAYFDVAHDDAKPFMVFSGKSFTRVLGTKFGVRAYDDEQVVKVVVEEGKVELGNGQAKSPTGRREILHNQIGILGETGDPQVSDIENVDEFLGWRKGELIFNNTRLAEVASVLERWYDVQIILTGSSLPERRLIAEFDDEPMTEVFNVISLSLGITYKREGRVIRFKEGMITH